MLHCWLQIAKEWHCSLRGNFFGAMLVTSVLLASLAAPHSAELAKVLFWLGAPAAMLLSIVRVGHNASHLNQVLQLPSCDMQKLPPDSLSCMTACVAMLAPHVCMWQLA